MGEYDLGATHFEGERIKDLGIALDNARHGRLSQDWRSSITAIERSVTESGGLVWYTPKTHERRSMPFPAVLADELSALIVGKGRDDLVFTEMRGGVLRNSNWRARVFQPRDREVPEGRRHVSLDHST